MATLFRFNGAAETQQLKQASKSYMSPGDVVLLPREGLSDHLADT